MAFRVLTMAVDLCRLTTRTMNVNAGHERTSKARIIHQIQLIRGITVEKKSFSLAAIELDVQEYILQLAIKQLENKFNVTLFNWESFSIILTESGMSIYEYFKLFDDELLILIEDFAED